MENNYGIDPEKQVDLIVKDCKKEEIKENGFKISFGVSIIILGVVCLFADINNTILVVVSISAFIFTFIDAIPKKNNLFYIFPLSVLLVFCVFPQLPFIKPFLDTKFNNSIVFISFGITFIINSYTSFKDRLRNANNKLDNNINSRHLSDSHMENSVIIMNYLIKLKEICIENEIENKQLNDTFDELYKYAQEEVSLSSIRKDLIYLSIKNNSSSFTVEEVEKILIDRSGFKRGKLKDMMEEFYEEHPEFKVKSSVEDE